LQKRSNRNQVAPFAVLQCMEPWVRTASRIIKARALLPAVLADWNGKPFNTAAIGRDLDVSRPTAVSYVRSMQEEGLARLLPFYGGGRRPLLVLSQQTPGCWVETIAGKVSKAVPESQFYWWKTGRCRQVDLIAEMKGERIGFNFLDAWIPQRKHWIALEKAQREGVIHRGFLLFQGEGAFITSGGVVVLPIDSFMQELGSWLSDRQPRKEIVDGLRRLNIEDYCRLSPFCLARWTSHR
jgi:hypothetical protein